MDLIPTEDGKLLKNKINGALLNIDAPGLEAYKTARNAKVKEKQETNDRLTALEDQLGGIYKLLLEIKNQNDKTDS